MSARDKNDLLVALSICEQDNIALRKERDGLKAEVNELSALKDYNRNNLLRAEMAEDGLREWKARAEAAGDIIESVRALGNHLGPSHRCSLTCPRYTDAVDALLTYDEAARRKR